MTIFQKALLPLSLMGIIVACAPATRLEKSWTDPSVKKGMEPPFKKVLVIAALKNESSIRITEDKIVAQIKNAEGVQSYKYLKSSDTDQKQVEVKMINDGFDGLIVMRLKKVELSSSYVHGSYYGGWYGYRYGSPGYIVTDENFIVETNIYSLKEAKLLWSGTTSTLNPGKLDQTLDGIISTIRYELKRKGLLK